MTSPIPTTKASFLDLFERAGRVRPMIADIESPYGSDDPSVVKRNILYARLCTRAALSAGFVPYASHLFFTQPGMLDDGCPIQRQQGIDAGKILVREAAQVSLVFLDLGISQGMAYGIQDAREAGREVIEVYLFDELDPHIPFDALLERAVADGYLEHGGYYRDGWGVL